MAASIVCAFMTASVQYIRICTVFEKKEKNLNQLIEKLNNLNVSYSQFGFDNKSLEKENNLSGKDTKKKRQFYSTQKENNLSLFTSARVEYLPL